MTNKSCTA